MISVGILMSKEYIKAEMKKSLRVFFSVWGPFGCETSKTPGDKTHLALNSHLSPSDVFFAMPAHKKIF